MPSPPFLPHTRRIPTLCCVLLLSIEARAENLPRPPGPASPGTGTVEGTVFYRNDPRHAWRTARYYVKNPGQGELAEAVVALASPGLVQSPRRYPCVVTIDQRELRFTPETVAIRAGDRVRFTNSDPQTHNVSSADVRLRFNETMGSGQQMVQTFPRATGISRPIVVGCSIHSQMQAWIYVFAHPFYCVTPVTGRFRFENVQPGEYRLETAHSAGDLRGERTIRVSAGQIQRIEFVLTPKDRRPEE